jgi:hypothetical protein
MARELRKASEVDGMTFPYRAKDVSFIRIDDTGLVDYAKSLTEKIQLIATATADDRIIAVWPGRYSSDVFEIDNWGAALAVLNG